MTLFAGQQEGASGHNKSTIPTNPISSILGTSSNLQQVWKIWLITQKLEVVVVLSQEVATTNLVSPVMDYTKYKQKLESTGYSALPSPPRLMWWTHTQRDAQHHKTFVAKQQQR